MASGVDRIGLRGGCSGVFDLRRRGFAGHSKWANIKHKKAKNDKDRQVMMARFSREIAIAVKQGGPDRDANFRLDSIVRRALKANVTSQVINKAIGNANKPNENLEEVTYEGVGPGGALFVVRAVTDNRKRTAPVLRHILTKHGGNFGAGSSGFNFDLCGYLEVSLTDTDSPDAVVEDAIAAGAEDMVLPEDDTSGPKVVKLFCQPGDLKGVSKFLRGQKYDVQGEELVYRPKSMFTVENEEISAKLEKILRDLEEADDVESVFHNIE